MKELKRAKKLYIIAITLILAAVIAISVVYYFAFAWFASSNTVTSTGMITSVNADTGLEFTGYVTATHYKLSGEKITYTYTIGDGGTLSLNTKETLSSSGLAKTVFTLSDKTLTEYTRTSASDETWTKGSTETLTEKSDGTYSYTVTGESDETTTYVYYLVNNILPGEFIDVTLTFKKTDSTISGYKITLADFGTGTDNTFNLEGSDSIRTVTYGVLPAFQYSAAPITDVMYNETSGWGVKSSDGSWTGDTTTTYTTFHGEYDSTNNETGGFYWYQGYEYTQDSTYEVPLLTDDEESITGKFGSETDTASYTFRIKESFEEYNNLLSGTGATYSNYLSNKIMNIGQIRLEAVDT